jgi:hypothetical protein
LIYLLIELHDGVGEDVMDGLQHHRLQGRVHLHTTVNLLYMPGQSEGGKCSTGCVVDPDPHQNLKAGSASASICRHQAKCMEYEPILAHFQGVDPFFEAKIWTRIRIRVKNRNWIRSNKKSESGSASG